MRVSRFGRVLLKPCYAGWATGTGVRFEPRGNEALRLLDSFRAHKDRELPFDSSAASRPIGIGPIGIGPQGIGPLGIGIDCTALLVNCRPGNREVPFGVRPDMSHCVTGRDASDRCGGSKNPVQAIHPPRKEPRKLPQVWMTLLNAASPRLLSGERGSMKLRKWIIENG